MLHVVGDSKYGGGSVVILALARIAKSMGLDVDVLATDPVFRSEARSVGLGVVPLDVIWRPIRPLRDLRGALRLTRFLRQNRYDLVHTHTSKGGFIGRLAAKCAGVPAIVHTVHGFAFHERSHPVALRVFARLEAIAARWCDRIVTVSEFHRDWAVRLHIGRPGQVIAIPNGIDPGRVRAVRTGGEVRRDLGIPPQDIVILSVGRLATQKGLEYLLRAVRHIEVALHRPFRIVLAGTGPLHDRLASDCRSLGIDRRVQFVGFRDDPGNLLVACDLVVLPSLWEGLSIALLEAMAAGKPIVATTIGSNKEVTRNAEAALLVPPRDPAALANALVTLANDPAMAKRLADNGHRVFLERYTEERMLRQYAQVYSELLDQRRR